MPEVASPGSGPEPLVYYVIESLGAGGAERSLVDLLPYLSSAGFQVTVVCLKHAAIGFEEEFRRAGGTLRTLPQGSVWSKVRALRRIIARNPVRLVHTTLFYGDLVGRLAAVGSGVPVLTSLVNTSYGPGRLKDPNVRRARLAVLRAVDAVSAHWLTDHFHAITHAVRDDAVRSLGLPADRITVVSRGRARERLGHPGPERRRRVRRELGLAEDAEVVINVGRQEYQKGQEYLLRAVAPLLRSRPRLEVLIAGRPGHATPALNGVVEELGVGDRVRFLGHREDVPDLLSAADLFVFPSLYEGLGGAVIEAMALGLPVVASAIPAIAEVVQDGASGILVEPASPEPLTAAIEGLLDDPSQRARFGERGMAIFQERFTLEKSAEGMVSLYRTLVGDRPERADHP